MHEVEKKIRVGSRYRTEENRDVERCEKEDLLECVHKQIDVLEGFSKVLKVVIKEEGQEFDAEEGL